MSEKINPWTQPTQVPVDETLEWEELPLGNEPRVFRLKVEGGWLYRLNKSTVATFVPE